MSLVYSSFALRSIFSAFNGLVRLEPTTWNILKATGIARHVTKRGCRAGTRKVRPITTIQGYGRYSGLSTDLHTSSYWGFQNNHSTHFMQNLPRSFGRVNLNSNLIKVNVNKHPSVPKVIPKCFIVNARSIAY